MKKFFKNPRVHFYGYLMLFALGYVTSTCYLIYLGEDGERPWWGFLLHLPLIFWVMWTWNRTETYRKKLSVHLNIQDDEETNSRFYNIYIDNASPDQAREITEIVTRQIKKGML